MLWIDKKKVGFAKIKDPKLSLFFRNVFMEIGKINYFFWLNDHFLLDKLRKTIKNANRSKKQEILIVFRVKHNEILIKLFVLS